MNRFSPDTLRFVHAAVASGMALGLAACASPGKPPTAELTSAQASITQAESAGAVQQAPVELLTAREKLGRAQAAAREERFDQARRLANQAEVDAELAEQKSRVAKAQTAAQELARANDLLRREIERSGRP